MEQTSFSISKKLSERLRDYRIDLSMTQKELSDRSGVSVRSIHNFENGSDIQLGNLIKLLKALELADNLELLVPDVSQKPSVFLEGSRKKMRASHKNTAEKSAFKWGDEQ